MIGQIIGASNYDIGHLALGQPGGGVANLGVVGRSNKAGGCTGVPTPVGDLYAIDYVAHEMGHQFGGNHTFNGNQLNCSGGNRNGPTSVEPGSGQSIMAYAGICLTDDEQPHSDGYFSERSQQEINAYVSSSQSPINEVQTVSLRHFGGGNETQVVTFGPGYAKAASITPLSLTINAAPSATSRGGAQETGTTVTIATGSAHTLQVGDTVTVAGVAEPGYNGTFTVTAVPSTRSFQYTNSVSGLPVSGGGTATPAIPGASSSGTTATIHTSTPHGRSVGDVVVISGVGVGGVQRDVHGHGRSEPDDVPVHDREPAGQLGRRVVDVLLAVQGAHRRQRLGADRRHGPPLHRCESDDCDQRNRGLPGHGQRDERHGDRLQRSPTREHLRASTFRTSSWSSSTAAASRPSRRRTTAGRWTRSGSTTTATCPTRS